MRRAPKPVWHYPWHYGFAKKSKSFAKKSFSLYNFQKIMAENIQDDIWRKCLRENDW
jgi:hypothetical protein